MKFLKLVPKKIYLLIIIPAIFSLILYAGAKIKINPKKYEKVEVLISALNLNNKLLEEKIIDSDKVDVKEINITFSVYDSSSMSLVYNTIFSEMDVLIFPKTFLDQNIEANFKQYAELSEEVVSKYATNPSYYEFNGNKYAIKVFDSITKKGWCDSIISYGNEAFNEDYYMFFNKKSVNLGNLNNSDYDNALTFMKAMNEYEK